MLNLVVCLKQVPMVTELPWDEKTGTLRRDLAAGDTAGHDVGAQAFHWHGSSALIEQLAFDLATGR